ncbi:hypothetical protein GN958_ATG16603 [Phytophthora infestans]|uniref:Uncharacterized protein n=1 Tax=Phytophthora infestans TaxID=4787 RepID=A0A8S9U3K1_PHYIN|nr:hypothetical protein GN958_ATG16603 [Phytophthora infestans]
MHLSEQRQWVTGLPPDISEADKTRRFKALRKMTKRLVKEKLGKGKLGRKCDDMSKRFLQDDKDIRKLVTESLAE